VVPGRVVLTLELRDIDPAVIEGVFARIEVEARRIAAATGTAVALEPTVSVAPALTAPLVRASIEAAAASLRLKAMAMPSGAGHDAQNMTVLGSSGMLFVPSVDGVSHSPRELTHDRDVVNGADVLLGAVVGVDAVAAH
jgi:N-carbamoyl-L-amino-acid hydrolase